MTALGELARVRKENLVAEKREPLRPHILTTNELVKKDIPPRKAIVEPWLLESSLGWIFAKRGIGKTWLVMHLAMTLAKGEATFLVYGVPQRRNVLFVDGEMALADLKERFSGLASSQPNNLFLLPSESLFQSSMPLAIDDTSDQEAVLEALATLENEGTPIDLIILDNLSSLRRGVDENDNSQLDSLLSWLISLRHSGYSVLLVHHENKSGGFRGASRIEVPFDYAIQLLEPEKEEAGHHLGAQFNMTFTKLRGKPPDIMETNIRLEVGQRGELEFTYRPRINAPPHIKLLRLLGTRPIRSQREAAEYLGKSVGATNKWLKQLRREGLIGQKDYTPTNAGGVELHRRYPAEFAKVEPEEFPF